MSELFDDLDVPSETDHDVVLSPDDQPFIMVPIWLYEQYCAQLGAYGLAVYVGLRSHANRKQGMRTFVASKTLAKELGIGESTVRRELAKMSEIGLLGRKLRQNRSTVYGITPFHLLRGSDHPPQCSDHPPQCSDITIRSNQKNITKELCPPREDESVILHRRSVETVYYYYISIMNRDPKLYCLTPFREKKMLTRLSECLSKTSGDVPRAVELMKCAVDGLAANEFCMGKNDKKRKFNDLIDNLFKSYEEMEKRWN